MPHFTIVDAMQVSPRLLHLRNLLTAALVLIVAGCSTTTPKNELSWQALLDADSSLATSNQTRYDRSQLEKDMLQLQRVQKELESLNADITTLQRTLAFQDQPYFDDNANKEIELKLFRFINARDTLSNLVHTYRTSLGLTRTRRLKAPC